MGHDCFRSAGTGRAWVPSLCVVLALAAGCSSGGDVLSPREEIQSLEERPWGEPDHVIAEVNDRAITRGGFYHRVLERFGTATVLSGVIKEELFLQEANRRGIEVSTREVLDEVDDVIAERARSVGGETELARIYQREGLSLADVRREMEPEIRSQLLVAKVTKALREVDDEMLREYYQQTYRYTRYKTRHIAYSFVPRPGQPEGEANRLRLEAFNKALRAADRVRKGANFADLARAESEDPVTAADGGDLDYIHEDSPMDPALKKAVLELSEGEVSDPVENPNGGYHVFQVTEILPSESFVDCKEKMRREILEQEPDLEEIEQAVMTLRDRGSVQIFGFPDEESGMDAER